MIRLAKFNIIAAIVLVFLVTVFFQLISVDMKPVSQAVIFQSRQPTDVDSVVVVNPSGGFKISYSETDGGYIVDDIPADLVDMDAFIDLMARCASIGALRKISSKTDGLSAFGLEEPQANVSVVYSDGDIFTFSIGGKEPVSGDFYIKTETDSAVYLFAAENAGKFLAAKENYADHRVTPDLVVSSPLSAVLDVTFSGAWFPEPVSIESVKAGNEEVRRAAVSFGAVTHIVWGRGVHELDQTYGIEILGSLLGIKALEVVDYSLIGEELSGMGFDTPDIVAEFDLKNGTEEAVHYVLSLVKQPDENFLAHISGKDAVFKIGKPAFAGIRYEKLMLRWFISPLLLDISGVDVQTDAHMLEIKYNRSGNQDQTAAVNGIPLDISLFQTFYRLLTSASSNGDYLTDALISGEPKLTITYHYTDEKKENDVIRFYQGRTRRLYAEVNKVTEFDIRETFVTRVYEACENLLDGKAIEENW